VNRKRVYERDSRCFGYCGGPSKLIASILVHEGLLDSCDHPKINRGVGSREDPVILVQVVIGDGMKAWYSES